ncbi:hypothetical protein Ait01nite_008230 [Actinoplanes italicus]|nr:hypothetical protein Ait01nite_008230 [Actinoplanes italicus]
MTTTVTSGGLGWDEVTVDVVLSTKLSATRITGATDAGQGVCLRAVSIIGYSPLSHVLPTIKASVNVRPIGDAMWYDRRRATGVARDRHPSRLACHGFS